MICSEFCFEDDGGGCGDGGSVGGSCVGGDGGNVIVVVGKRRPLQLAILTLRWCWWQLLWVGLLNLSVFLVGLIVVLMVVIWL